jgi:hypothetical protein
MLASVSVCKYSKQPYLTYLVKLLLLNTVHTIHEILLPTGYEKEQ